MSEKEFEKIYGEYWDNLEQAPDRVRNAYQAMHEAFDEYLCAVEEWTFLTAFDFAMDYVSKNEMRKEV